MIFSCISCLGAMSSVKHSILLGKPEVTISNDVGALPLSVLSLFKNYLNSIPGVFARAKVLSWVFL